MASQAKKLAKVHEDKRISACETVRFTFRETSLSEGVLRKIDAYRQDGLCLCCGWCFFRGQPFVLRNAQTSAFKAKAAGLLGFGRRPVLHLHSFKPADQRIRPERVLYTRIRSRDLQEITDWKRKF